MRYLRFIFGVCALSLVAATTAFSKSLEYKAGKAAAYIDHCGHYDLNLALHKKYGKSKDYRNGEIENDLSGYDSVSGIDCEVVGKFVNQLLGRTVPSVDEDTDTYICRGALVSEGINWDYKYQKYVSKAKARGLSEQDCARILGRTTTVASSKGTANKGSKRSSAYEAGRLAAANHYCKKTEIVYKLDQLYANHEEYLYAKRRFFKSPKVKTRSFIREECATNEKLALRLLPANTFVSAYDGVSDSAICENGLIPNGEAWNTSDIFVGGYISEAKSRGLSEQDCANILVRTSTVASTRSNTSVVPTNTNAYRLCRLALNVTSGSWDYSTNVFRRKVEEAKSLGLSEQECARNIGFNVRTTTVASTRSKTSVVPTNTNEWSRTVCYMALDKKMGTWSHAANSRVYVKTAKSRGYSPQYCARILGGTTTVASKPNPQPSQALVKRTQEALTSLSLYRGSVDGVAGVQSKSALKQWQKRAGLDVTGEIKEDQIAQLESDALKVLTKREEERKAKARRVAEANRIKNPDAIAVIIGNRDYKGDTPDVEFAVNDADAMREFVLNKLGYRAGNIIDLRDATQAELLSAFGSKESHKGTLFDYVRAHESDVIVFYSGHGVPGLSDRRGYLLSVDANPNKAELTGYPVDTLLKNLSKVPAKSMTVFIDACFSGNTPKGMLVDAMSGLTVEIRQPKKTSKGMVVLTASRGDQVASWDKNAKHGLFTKHLLEALNGAADKQSKTGNKDGKVTLGEVKAYLDREMTYQARRRFSRDQHATVSGDLKTVLSAY